MLDSTADFPDAQMRFPNMRVVPLYVRFGEESFRDYVELDPHDFYERLRVARRAADDLAADAAGLPRPSTRSSPATSGSTRCTSPRSSRARSRARRSRPRSSAATGSGSSTPRPPRSGSRCSRSRSSGCSSGARPTRRSRRSSSATASEAGLLFTVDTLEYLAKGGRIGRAQALAGQPAEREADPDDRGRRGRAADARARPREGARGVPQALRGGDDATAPGLRVGIAHAEAPERGRAAARRSSRRRARRPRSSS